MPEASANSGEFRSDNDRPDIAGKSPFVDIQVAGKELALVPNFLESFNEQPISDSMPFMVGTRAAIPQATFVLFDRGYNILDTIFLPAFLAYAAKEKPYETGPLIPGVDLGPASPVKEGPLTKLFRDVVESIVGPTKPGPPVVRWQFGWNRDSNDPRDRSRVREGYITNITHEFVVGGTRIVVECCGTAVVGGQGVYTRRFGPDGRPLTLGQAPDDPNYKVRPSDIAAYLADEMGFTDIRVEETEEVDNNLLTQNNEDNYTYIKKVLIPHSKSTESGSTDFKWTPNTGNAAFEYSTKIGGGRVKRRYFWAREKSAQVLSYQPKLDNAAVISGLYSGVQAAGFDPINKELLFERATPDDVSESLPRLNGSQPTVPLEVDGIPIAGRVYVSPIDAREALAIFARNRMESNVREVFTAGARIVGDASLGMGDFLEFVVITDNGDVHFTSGQFQANKVVHTISPGKFETNLEMQGTGARVFGLGDEKGIKIDMKYINYDVEEAGTTEVTSEE